MSKGIEKLSNINSNIVLNLVTKRRRITQTKKTTYLLMSADPRTSTGVALVQARNGISAQVHSNGLFPASISSRYSRRDSSPASGAVSWLPAMTSFDRTRVDSRPESASKCIRLPSMYRVLRWCRPARRSGGWIALIPLYDISSTSKHTHRHTHNILSCTNYFKIKVATIP